MNFNASNMEAVDLRKAIDKNRRLLRVLGGRKKKASDLELVVEGALRSDHT